uniref:RRM domain-containing protein n=1 Tax=Globodera rostochiensis TaxID=31243 RepID=A0A914I0P7_GLORO
MKRPKRDNSRTKSSSGTDGPSCNRHFVDNSSPPEDSNNRQHRWSSTSFQPAATMATADVLKKVPKMNGTIRGRARQSSSNEADIEAEPARRVGQLDSARSQCETSVYIGMRDSTTSSSSASSSSSALRRPFDHACNLFLHQQALNSSCNLSLSATPTSNNDLLLPSPTTALLHQIGPSQLGSMPLSYGPFGLPQIAGGVPATHQQSLMHFHQQQQPLLDQQQLFQSLAMGHGLSAGLMSVPQSAFEGLPIFVLPHAGTLSLSALQRAAEFKAMALNAMLQQQHGAKVDTSKHFHIFVGDLSQEVDNQMLMEACQKFGEVSEAKVMRDFQSSKSRSFGFVAFTNKEDARRAIEGLNGMLLGRRPLRTGWAVRRSSVGNGGGGQQHGSEDEGLTFEKEHSLLKRGNQQPTLKTVSFESVFNSTDVDNTTIYLGGLPGAVTEEPIRSLFSQFGAIKEIRLFASQNFGFVVFADKSSAAQSILEMHGRELDLGVVAGKCTARVKWGRQPQQPQNGAMANERHGTNSNGGTVPNNTIPTLMELSRQKSAAAASVAAVAVRLAQQQQMALSALAAQQQQIVRFPAGVNHPQLMATQAQNLANGAAGAMAMFGGWGNE